MNEGVDHLFMLILGHREVACFAKAVCTNGVCALGLELDGLNQGKVPAAFENRAVKTVVEAEYSFQIPFFDCGDLGGIKRAQSCDNLGVHREFDASYCCVVQDIAQLVYLLDFLAGVSANMGAFIRLPHHKSPCRQYVDGASDTVTRRRELGHQIIFDQPLKWRDAAKNDVHLKAIGNGILLVTGVWLNVLKGQKTGFSVQI